MDWFTFDPWILINGALLGFGVAVWLKLLRVHRVACTLWFVLLQIERRGVWLSPYERMLMIEARKVLSGKPQNSVHSL